MSNNYGGMKLKKPLFGLWCSQNQYCNVLSWSSMKYELFSVHSNQRNACVYLNWTPHTEQTNRTRVFFSRKEDQQDNSFKPTSFILCQLFDESNPRVIDHWQNRVPCGCLYSEGPRGSWRSVTSFSQHFLESAIKSEPTFPSRLFPYPTASAITISGKTVITIMTSIFLGNLSYTILYNAQTATEAVTSRSKLDRHCYVLSF